MKTINVKTLSEPTQTFLNANAALAGYYGVDRQPDGKAEVYLFPQGRNPALPPPSDAVAQDLLRAALTEDGGAATVYEFTAGASRPTQPDRSSFEQSVKGERQYAAAVKLYRRAAGYQAAQGENRVSRKAFDAMSHEDRMAVIKSGAKLYDEASQ